MRDHAAMYFNINNLPVVKQLNQGLVVKTTGDNEQ